MSIFGRRKVEPEVEQTVEEGERKVEEQRKVSNATLEYVARVLDRKDELLADAVNQTGSAVRARKKSTLSRRT